MIITSSETTPRAHVADRGGERLNGVGSWPVSRHGERQSNQESTNLTRPKVSFIAWAEDSGRAFEIAAALGGEARVFYLFRIVWKPLIPLRYLLNAISTCGYLASRRPRAVIVTNPPIFPGLIAALYCIATRAPLLMDSHPSAFGTGPMTRQFARAHAWLARRAATTMVTVPELAEIVTAWGGRADIVHEAPPAHGVAGADPPPGRPRILYIGRFAGDEPTKEVIEAARLIPGVDVLITGDVRKCPAPLRKSAPSNVRFTGFLESDDYRKALEEAAVILVLTRHPQAVNRGAYEAVYCGRPLIISDLPAMTPLFPFAVPVHNDSASIAQGIQLVVGRYAQVVSACPQALALQQQRWQQQLDSLRELISC